jgi:predicted lipid-binding transport protein (Tim44 family)
VTAGGSLHGEDRMPSTRPRPEQFATAAEYRWARHLWRRAHGGSLIGTLAIAVFFGALTGSTALLVLLIVFALVATMIARRR